VTGFLLALIHRWNLPQFLYNWQTLFAGSLALVAAWLTLRAARRKERQDVEAMRKSLAVEIRRLVDILRQTREGFIAAVQSARAPLVSDVVKQTSRGVPIVYPATADRVGLLGDVAPDVVGFYANLKDVEFAGRMTNAIYLAPDQGDQGPYVPLTDLPGLIDLIEKAHQSAPPLLSQLNSQERRPWWRRLVG
jgi:hypothetical protein